MYLKYTPPDNNSNCKSFKLRIKFTLLSTRAIIWKSKLFFLSFRYPPVTWGRIPLYLGRESPLYLGGRSELCDKAIYIFTLSLRGGDLPPWQSALGLIRRCHCSLPFFSMRRILPVLGGKERIVRRSKPPQTWQVN
jgi:hypothetical protein